MRMVRPLPGTREVAAAIPFADMPMGEGSAVSTEEPDDRPLTEEQRGWRTRVATLISYRYLGTYSEAVDRHAAEGWLKIRRDMRGPVGLLSSPLGVALLDTAGINVDPLAVVAPTRIDVDIFETAEDVEEVHLEGRILREGRSQFFTEGRLTDNADRRRTIATGITHWAVSGPNPGFSYVDNRPGVSDSPDLPPLYQPFGARLRSDGEFEIPEITPELGGRALHQGPHQVVTEAAAMEAARRVLGRDRFWIEHQGTSIMARADEGPLVTRSEILRLSDETVTVRVELRTGGGKSKLCSLSVCRFRIV
jgi:acyl-coenzyme A thioesterase PaaI-like protein